MMNDKEFGDLYSICWAGWFLAVFGAILTDYGIQGEGMIILGAFLMGITSLTFIFKAVKDIRETNKRIRMRKLHERWW